ncbi:MAG: radical SAM protein [Cytophagales bacterium]|nr:radical SAM protein [Cytophagales bacterium]
MTNTQTETISPAAAAKTARLWMPKRVLFTPAALDEPFGRQIHKRISSLGIEPVVLPSNRLTNLRGADERETYRNAKNTLAVVTAPPGALRLQPIPPSADWQFHLAEGCPAHCQYCYLAGSLQGPPVTRVFANLPAILENTIRYEQPGRFTTFEASCYTDPLGIEHLTGSLEASIRHFRQRENTQLRWVTKFDHVEPLLGLPHHGRVRPRLSLNAEIVTRRLEGGTASLSSRLAALRKLALPTVLGGGGYPVGVVLAPIMPIPGWQEAYTQLFDQIGQALDFPCDLTFELISHRFTPGSKEVLTGWYPNTSLEMDEARRVKKTNKFGGVKYVYPGDQMRALRQFFEAKIASRFPDARVLYWT